MLLGNKLSNVLADNLFELQPLAFSEFFPPCEGVAVACRVRVVHREAPIVHERDGTEHAALQLFIRTGNLLKPGRPGFVLDQTPEIRQQLEDACDFSLRYCTMVKEPQVKRMCRVHQLDKIVLKVTAQS